MANDFNAALGVRPGDEPGSLVLDPRPEHEIAPDVVHFAVLTALGEISAARAVEAPVVPATVTVHLLSRARRAPLVGKGSSRVATFDRSTPASYTLAERARVDGRVSRPKEPSQL